MKKIGIGALQPVWKTAFAMLIAFTVGAVFLLCIGANPITVYGAILSKTFGSFDTTLRRAMPLMLTGLAVAIPLKAGSFNMGGEGQIIAGALTAAVIGSLDMGLPKGVHGLVAILAAMVVGASLAGVCGVLKMTRGANEVVTTLMLNNIVALLVTWLVLNPFKGTDYSPQSKKILATAEIPAIGRLDISWGFFVALALCVFMAFFFARSRKGLEMRAAGANPIASGYLGINRNWIGLLGMLLGGAMAATGGALEVLGGQHVYFDEYFTNYGFDGIAIAYMAGGNPIGIIFTALIVAMIRVGALAISRKTGMSPYFVTMLQGIIIVLLVVPKFTELLSSRVKALFARKKDRKGGAKA